MHVASAAAAQVVRFRRTSAGRISAWVSPWPSLRWIAMEITRSRMTAGLERHPEKHQIAQIDVKEDAMPTVDATTFRRDFGRYQDEAHREPVKVTSHGRVVGVFMSCYDLEHFERLKRRERQVYVAGEFPDDIVDAIEKAEYLNPAA
jgi:hypothetical protein